MSANVQHESGAQPRDNAVPTIVNRPCFYDMGGFARFTGLVGVTLLVAGLAMWKFRPGEHRLALMILVCAMFLAYCTTTPSRTPGGALSGRAASEALSSSSSPTRRD